MERKSAYPRPEFLPAPVISGAVVSVVWATNGDSAMIASCEGGTCDVSNCWLVGDTRFEGSAAACESFCARSTPELPCAGGRGDAFECPWIGDALSDGSAIGCKSEGGGTGALVIVSAT